MIAKKEQRRREAVDVLGNGKKKGLYRKKIKKTLPKRMSPYTLLGSFGY